jgi:hypothetical protein
MKNKKLCTGCNEPIHPKRLEILPTTTRCVSCSNTNKKAGITVTKGKGDHTYTETIVLEHEDFVEYKKIEAKLNKTSFDEIPTEDIILPQIIDDEEGALDFTNIGE